MKSLAASVVPISFPLGTVIPYAGNDDPFSRDVLAKSGWLICDGAEVSRFVYRSLYQVIGDIHGRGDGVNTFHLPDYRGRFLRGVDKGSGRDPNAQERMPSNPGGWDKDAVGSVQGHQLCEHKHIGLKFSDSPTNELLNVLSSGKGYLSIERQTSVTGGRETRPINVGVHWLILAGIPT